MRRVWDRCIAYVSSSHAPPNADKWQQAGFSSIAYRLAHFSASRTLVLGFISAIFYFC